MKKILITGLNNNQIPYLKEIKKLKFELIGTDGFENPVGKSFCDKFYNISYTDFNGLMDIVKKENLSKNDFLFSASSQESYLALSKIAEILNINFPKFENIETALSKVNLYKFFEKNKIPFPKTEFIKNEKELFEKLKNENYYLKSDYSKNPNYVYKIDNSFDFKLVNWEKDRYLKEFYILQEEFIGTHLRFNVFGDFFSLYNFEVNEGILVTVPKKGIFEKVRKLKIPEILKNICNILQFQKILVKFDVILEKEQFAVLDIGIDPPFRMRNYYESKNLNFYEFYVKHYLLNEINYPLKDKI